MTISDQKLQQDIAQLPSELTPERDLWPGIERALQVKSGERVSNRNRKVVAPVAWAASIVAAVLLTWVNVTPQGDTTDSPSLLNVMQTDFQQQRQLLLVSFGQPDISKLSPEMQAELAKLASARQTIEKALLEDPENGDLLNLLRWTQQQELEFIEQLFRPQWQSI